MVFRFAMSALMRCSCHKPRIWQALQGCSGERAERLLVLPTPNAGVCEGSAFCE